MNVSICASGIGTVEPADGEPTDGEPADGELVDGELVDGDLRGSASTLGETLSFAVSA